MPLKLIAIGLVAGLFSALFGVGGGIVTQRGGTDGSPTSPLLLSLPAPGCALPGKARHRDANDVRNRGGASC